MIVKFASMLEASGLVMRDEAAVATALAEQRDTVILALIVGGRGREMQATWRVDRKVAGTTSRSAPTPPNPSTGRATTTSPGSCSTRSTSSLSRINCQYRSAATSNLWYC